VLVERADAHHGAGLYDARKNGARGKLTRLFVNPHSYVYFDVVGNDGKVIAMKCGCGRPRCSTLGLVAGDVRAGRVHQGYGPPASRIRLRALWNVDAGGAPTLVRYRQLSDAKSSNRTKRPFQLPNGKRITPAVGAGATGPGRAAGGRARLVPIIKAAAINAGKLPMPAGPASVCARDVDRSGTCGSRNAQTADVGEPAALLQITSILFG
jgi:hypothetical protein